MAEAEEIRRAFLRAGGSATEAASALGITRSAVYQALARANKRSPLIVPIVRMPGLDPTDPDSQAIVEYVKSALSAAGILREPKSTP